MIAAVANMIAAVAHMIAAVAHMIVALSHDFCVLTVFTFSSASLLFPGREKLMINLDNCLQSMDRRTNLVFTIPECRTEDLAKEYGVLK